MATDDEIRAALWNCEHASLDGTKAGEFLLEQYKIYVEMADRISQRRGAANTFFLTFNTAVVGALAALFNKVPTLAAVGLYAAAVVFSVAWGLLLRSYRNLNTAKFLVIGMMEERLPASPYYAAEWKALGEGKDWRKYVPLSFIETAVPLVFLLIYVYFAMVALSP